jgi:hypothetical protein
VLWQQVSNLLLKYTKSGYETALTAACARQASVDALHKIFEPTDQI